MNETLLADRRDQISERLATGFAHGLFEVDELERRLSVVQTAQSSAELDALTTDLVPVTSTALVPAKRMRVVFGSIERVGPWVVPQDLTARVAFGSLVLDLREARLAPGVTTIEVHVTMGNIEVVVPPGMAVEVDVSSFMGNVEQRTDHVSAETPTTVRIVGHVKLGNLELMTLRAGETQRDAKWRRRQERRAYRRFRRLTHHRAMSSPFEW